MEFPNIGSSDSFVLQELKKLQSSDMNFKDGNILGSMCTSCDSIAEKIACCFLNTNIGDPGLFPGTKNIEDQVISMMGDLLSLPNAAGTMTSGGSEANILALWGAKREHPQKTEVVLPESAHFSFDKAASLLGLTLRKIPVNSQHQFNLEQYYEAINEKTLSLVAVAGTTGLGAVDPIQSISAFALEKKLWLHVDAAFGGFIIPFMNRRDLQFDFSLEGVTSITIDPHKMGTGLMPAGALLFRPVKLGYFETSVSYLAGGKTTHLSFTGTRPGSSIAAFWAILRKKGRSGFNEQAEQAMALTHYTYNELNKISKLEIINQPVLNIIGFRHKTIQFTEFASMLRKNGFALGEFHNHLRIVLMPHVKKDHIDSFLNTLKELV